MLELWLVATEIISFFKISFTLISFNSHSGSDYDTGQHSKGMTEFPDQGLVALLLPETQIPLCV